MSGAPHKLWKDFDKVFDKDCITREEASWELAIKFRKNVFRSILKLLTELRILQTWFIDGAQITLDVRQCAQVQFSAEGLLGEVFRAASQLVNLQCRKRW